MKDQFLHLHRKQPRPAFSKRLYERLTSSSSGETGAGAATPLAPTRRSFAWGLVTLAMTLGMVFSSGGFGPTLIRRLSYPAMTATAETRMVSSQPVSGARLNAAPVADDAERIITPGAQVYVFSPPAGVKQEAVPTAPVPRQ